jgi:hypothetical protein
MYLRIYTEREDTEAAYLWKQHAFYFLLASFLNACKFPERLFPGYFDWLGNSHQLFHISTSIGTWYQLLALTEDMERRPMNEVRLKSMLSL